MFLSDDVLEEIADYLHMNLAEKEMFIENIRENEVEIFWQSFLIYYEENKGELEKKYLQKLTQGIEHDEEKQKKFMQIFSTETTNNPELADFMMKRISQFLVRLILEFTKVADENTIKKIAYLIFEHSNLVTGAIQSGQVKY